MTPRETLKAEILEKVAEYCRLAHASARDAPFVPGKTRVNYAGRVFDEREMVNLVDASLDFWLTYGDWSRAFERRFADYLGVRWALLVNSGSSANLLAFMALTSPLLGERRVRRGDEVITVACGFPTTVAPVVQYGAVPVFVDVELSTANVDAAQLERALSPRTKAVMLAHTLGNPFDVTAVKAFCDRHGLWLVEDNCDALGSRVGGRLTGTFGDIGTSSFYPPHHMTTGEGGAVYTGNPLLRKIMLSVRDWGRDCWCDSGADDTCGCRFSRQHGSLPFGYDHKYVYGHFGYNLKATDLQAAVGCAQLDKLDGFTAARRANFRALLDGLGGVGWLSLPRASEGAEPSWFGFLMTLRDGAPVTRNRLAEHLERDGIQTRNLFAGNLTRHPCFDGLRAGVDYRVAAPLANTDKIMADSLWVGVYPGMDAPRLAHVADSVRRCLGGAGESGAPPEHHRL